ncbi:MAG: hypothetical protein M3R38_29980 [Actinomycetota bacterium]|nr:hypothetical protein [Actinomycetota bacterium]
MIEARTVAPVGLQQTGLAFEMAALGINDIVRVASATRFPAVSFTPISIYRTC